MCKSSCLCFAFTDHFRGRDERLFERCGYIIVDLFFGFQDFAGYSINLILVFKASCFKVNVIDHDAAFCIHFGFAGQHRCCIHTGMCKGDCFCFFRADIGFFTGGADRFNLRFRRRYVPPQQVQLVDGEGSQLVEGMPPVIVQNVPDQLCFSDGNAVGFCQLFQRVVFCNGLTQHSAAECFGLQQLIDRICELRLHGCAALGIVVVNADEDGIRKLTQITVLHHGADDCVDCHPKVAAAKVHIADDDLTVRIQRRDLQHPLFPVDCNFYARIDIQRNRGIHGIVDLIPQIAEDAACRKAQACSKRGETRKRTFYLFCCCHTYTAFRFCAVGAHGGQNIRCSVRISIPQLFVDFMFCHDRYLLLVNVVSVF